MTVTEKKRTGVAINLAMAAKLCKKHGYSQWDEQIRLQLVPRIKTYEGLDCADMRELVLQDKELTPAENFETMLCNQLSTYIDVMKINKCPDDLPPFSNLNDIVMDHVDAVLYLVGLIISKKGLNDASNMCLLSGVPLEYLHTLVRAFHNKVLMLRYQGKMFSNEYYAMSNKCDDLYQQYKCYSPEEIHRVSLHYKRDCLGQYYPPVVPNQPEQ